MPLRICHQVTPVSREPGSNQRKLQWVFPSQFDTRSLPHRTLCLPIYLYNPGDEQGGGAHLADGEAEV